jgi:hypothetical protein
MAAVPPPSNQINIYPVQRESHPIQTIHEQHGFSGELSTGQEPQKYLRLKINLHTN